MTNITDAAVVYVSSSDNADYIEATPHEDSVAFIRADVVKAVLDLVAEGVTIGTAYTQVAHKLNVRRKDVSETYLLTYHLPRIKERYPNMFEE